MAFNQQHPFYNPALPSQPGIPTLPPQPGFPPQHAIPPVCGFPSYPSAVAYTVPYKTIINGGLYPGKNIIIQGIINPNAKRVAFNLCHRTGIALHYNPRFDENLVVRNSHKMEKWGAEERFGGMPFQRGHPFQVTITCNPHHYNVFVNGQQAHTFNHRYTNLHEIDILEVCGDVQLTLVQV